MENGDPQRRHGGRNPPRDEGRTCQAHRLHHPRKTGKSAAVSRQGRLGGNYFNHLEFTRTQLRGGF